MLLYLKVGSLTVFKIFWRLDIVQLLFPRWECITTVSLKLPLNYRSFTRKDG